MLFAEYFMTPGAGLSLGFIDAHTDPRTDDVSCCRMRNNRIKVDDIVLI